MSSRFDVQQTTNNNCVAQFADDWRCAVCGMLLHIFSQMLALKLSLTSRTLSMLFRIMHHQGTRGVDFCGRAHAIWFPGLWFRKKIVIFCVSELLVSCRFAVQYTANSCTIKIKRLPQGGKKLKPDMSTIHIHHFFFLKERQEHCHIMLEGEESQVLQWFDYINNKDKLLTSHELTSKNLEPPAGHMLRHAASSPPLSA